MTDIIPIQLAVEDVVSEALLRKVLRQLGPQFQVGTCFCRGGFGYLKKRIKGFNSAAKGTPFLVLTDLDQGECAPTLLTEWLGVPKHHNLLFRVAVREVESWLLAHRSAFAKFLGISARLVPSSTDELPDPKKTLIELASKSKRRELRKAIVPPKGSTARIGPDYNGRLRQYIQRYWDVQEAQKISPSLQRTYQAIRAFRPILADQKT